MNTVYRSNKNTSYLYFISVFIYTYIKVKLTEGEKRWLCQSQAEPLLTFSFGCKRIRTQKQRKIRPCQATKATPEIRELAFHFVALIGKIIPDMIFAEWRFRDKRERLPPFTLRFETSNEGKR